MYNVLISMVFFPLWKKLGFLCAGGLGDYGSDSEDERSERASESSDTDDEELHRRIRQKQDAFRRKERELQLLLQQQHEKQMEGMSAEDLLKSSIIQFFL